MSEQSRKDLRMVEIARNALQHGTLVAGMFTGYWQNSEESTRRYRAR